MKPPGKLLAVATIALLTLIWGTTWAAIRISLEGFGPFTGVALRFGMAGILMVAYARFRKVPLRATSRRERLLRLGHGLLSFCIPYGAVFWAEQWVPTGLASIIFATVTLFTAIMAHWIVPGEQLGVVAVAGIVLGFGGVGVIYGGGLDGLGGENVARAAAIMILGPLAAAAASVLIKRWGKDIAPVSLNAAAMLQASLAMIVLAVIVEHDRPVHIELAPVLALVYLAAIGTAVTFNLFLWILKYVEVRRVALIGYLCPMVAVLIGCLVLGEPMTLQVGLGSALVLLGVALAVRTKRRPEPAPVVPGGTRGSTQAAEPR